MSPSPHTVAVVPAPTPPLGVRPEVFPVAADVTGLYLLHDGAMRESVAPGLKVRVEVFPIAGDQAGLHLIDDAAPWVSGVIPLDSEPDELVKTILVEHQIWPGDTLLVHSTGWRVEADALVLTYLCVVRRGGNLVRNEWPHSQRIEPCLDNRVVPAALVHGLRHLRFLLDTDETNRAAFDELFRRHLAQLPPVLAGPPGQANMLASMAHRMAASRLQCEPLWLDATSWRPDTFTDRTVVVVSHLAVIPRRRELVYDEWPDALPITPRAMDQVGRPIPHSPIEPPLPSHWDVLTHALRGLHSQLAADPRVAAVLDEMWRNGMGELESWLVSLYDRERRTA